MSDVIDDILERINIFCMRTYKSLVIAAKTLEFYSFLIIKPWTVVTDVINEICDTFPDKVHIMLNIEPQIEKIILHLYKTIQYIVLFIVNGQN